MPSPGAQELDRPIRYPQRLPKHSQPPKQVSYQMPALALCCLSLLLQPGPRTGEAEDLQVEALLLALLQAAPLLVVGRLPAVALLTQRVVALPMVVGLLLAFQLAHRILPKALVAHWVEGVLQAVEAQRLVAEAFS